MFFCFCPLGGRRISQLCMMWLKYMAYLIVLCVFVDNYLRKCLVGSGKMRNFAAESD